MKNTNRTILLIVYCLAYIIRICFPSFDLTAQSDEYRPLMLYGDTTRNGKPFAKDPSVIHYKGRYLMYYSMPPSIDPYLPKGWSIGIAESSDLVNWQKIGNILPEQECEKKGIVNGRIIFLDGQLHLFYNSYGNFFNILLNIDPQTLYATPPVRTVFISCEIPPTPSGIRKINGTMVERLT